MLSIEAPFAQRVAHRAQGVERARLDRAQRHVTGRGSEVDAGERHAGGRPVIVRKSFTRSGRLDSNWISWFWSVVANSVRELVGPGRGGGAGGGEREDGGEGRCAAQEGRDTEDGEGSER